MYNDIQLFAEIIHIEIYKLVIFFNFKSYIAHALLHIIKYIHLLETRREIM